MAPAGDKTILPEYLELLAQSAGRAAAREVLTDHVSSCPVQALKNDVWGNGKPGLKAEVHDLARDVAVLTQSDLARRNARKSILLDWVRPAIVPLVSTGVAALIAWAVAVASVPKTSTAGNVPAPSTQPITYPRGVQP